MENFFIEENFCSDLEDLIRICDLEDDGAIEDLEEDWKIKVELSELEPLIVYNVGQFTDYIDEERMTEDGDEVDRTADIIKKYIAQINAEIPKLYYPIQKFEYISKQDLLDFIK